MTAATAARYPLPSDADDVAPDPETPHTATTDGLPTHGGSAVSALRLTGDPRGRWEVENAHVEITLTGVPVGELREFINTLDELIDAGKATVDAEVKAAEATDPQLVELLRAALATGERLDNYRAELAGYEGEAAVAAKRAEELIRRGEDPAPAEDVESAAADKVRQLKRRVDVTHNEVQRALARVEERRGQIAREVRARVLGDAQTEVEAIQAEIAAAVFPRLAEVNRLRGVINAVAPSR